MAKKQSSPTPPDRTGKSPAKPTTLCIRPFLGSIVEVDVPTVVVGRYIGTPTSGALQALDNRLGGWLEGAIERGILGSLLGELFFVPVPEGRLRAKAVVVAGMGEFGRFGPEELAYLVTNLVLAAKALGQAHFAMVPIGAGSNGMSLSQCVGAVIDGAVDGLARSAATAKLTVTLVTRQVSRLREIYDCLAEVRDKLNPGKLVHLDLPGPPEFEGMKDHPSRKRWDAAPEKGEEAVNRVIVTQEASHRRPTGQESQLVLSYAALTDRAVVPVRAREVKSFLVEELIQVLTRTVPRAPDDPPPGRTTQEHFGEMLADYLLPEDIRRYVENGRPLTLLLDVNTARYPWEMACYKSFHPRDSTNLDTFRRAWGYGTDLKLTRQFRTTQSAAPGLMPKINEHLEILLIADPAPDLPSFPSLKDARDEAAAVLGVVRQAVQKYDGRFTVGVTVRIGHPNDDDADERIEAMRELTAGVPGLTGDIRICTPLELASLFISKPFDVVHFTGHGVYSPRDGRIGWVVGSQYTLTADEVLKLRRVPRLVFANACQTSTVLRRPETAAAQLAFAGQVAGFIEAFFARGVENYLGAGWPIEARASAFFAEAFYRALLGVPTEGGDRVPTLRVADAAAEARRATRNHQELGAGSSWGAFQLYGSPYAVMARLKPKKEVDAGSSRSGRRR